MRTSPFSQPTRPFGTTYILNSTILDVVETVAKQSEYSLQNSIAGKIGGL